MRSVMNYDISRAPTMDAPRAKFDLSEGHKTTIDFDYLYPVYLREILPGDSFTFNPNIFARLATPIHPLMDNLSIDIHSAFIPMRQLWVNSRKFFGEQEDPGDSISYTIPQIAAPASTGYAELSLADYFGIPTKIPDYLHSALPFRALAHFYNHWFRDQNLIDSVTMSTADGPDTTTNTTLLKRGKRHDYFTSGLANPQKTPGTSQTLPLGTSAPITGFGASNVNAAAGSTQVRETDDTAPVTYTDGWNTGTQNIIIEEDPLNANYPNIRADLSNATAATVIQLRQSMAIQALLELDARAGSRYPEILYSTFGVTNFQDLTYRPEFLGGGSTPINIQQVPSTYDNNTQNTKGELGAYGTGFLNQGGWTKSFTEHGFVLSVVSAKCDITYQQGLHREWSRTTRYDYLYPILQNIGDQSVLVKELYCQDPATDTGATGTADNERTFCYQERYGEYKFGQNKITGLFRSNCTASLESWHGSEEFSSLPTFNQTFIEQNTPMDRAIVTATEPHLILDCYFNVKAARPMHMYSIPGFGNRF